MPLGNVRSVAGMRLASRPGASTVVLVWWRWCVGHADERPGSRSPSLAASVLTGTDAYSGLHADPIRADAHGHSLTLTLSLPMS